MVECHREREVECFKHYGAGKPAERQQAQGIDIEARKFTIEITLYSLHFL